ncbi:MAG: hypothetical protein JXA03_07990 [Bacteroidales bacterium]|nr:hypothetical protein [Bacteroidales bacterium]
MNITIITGFAGLALIMASAMSCDLSFIWIPGAMLILAITALRAYLGEIRHRSELWFRGLMSLLTIVILLISFL